ncbi:MAG TPA: CHAT domain-containing protein, partial [Ornithinibacter sp.]|nr:CHAT domain-containing protein [Ornithinibacter sp.]
MASRSYQNFDVLVETTAVGYRARVVTSPTGETPTVDFALPFDATVLENLLLKLDPGRSGTRRVAQNPQVQAARDFGGPLFDAVFAGDVALAWGRGQDAVSAADKGGLRLRLRLTDAPALAGLPWELLYDRRRNTFIAQSEKTPLVRYLDVPQPIRPLSVAGALRILVIVSSPTDLPELDGDAEYARVEQALAERISCGQVVLERLPRSTVSQLGQWLRSHDAHVLHFVGHGEFDPRLEEGVLYFCDDYGRSSAVTSSVLGPFVRDHDPLRLVVLNACRSAHVDQADPFSGMAQGLVQQDAAAVVAMQFPITDGAAIAFTGDFYGAVADGLPVDQAVTSARKTLNADFGAEWATPILFLRASDGEVFKGIAPPSAPAAKPVPAAAPPPVPVSPPVPVPPPMPVPIPVPAGGQDTAVDRGAGQRVTSTRPTTAPATGDTPDPPDPHDDDRTPLLRLLAIGAVVLVAAGFAFWLAARPDEALVADDGASVSPSPTLSTATTGTTSPSATPTNNAPTRAAEPGPTVEAARFASPPTIDGSAEEWDGHTAYDSNTVIAGRQATVRASWLLGWDTDTYYVHVTVTDPRVRQSHEDQPDQVWKGDSVGFELGVAAPEVRTDVLAPGDVHVLMGPTPDGRVVRAINVPVGKDFKPGPPFVGGEVQTLITADGYTMEAAIPWSLLNVPSPTAGLTLATNL